MSTLFEVFLCIFLLCCSYCFIGAGQSQAAMSTYSETELSRPPVVQQKKKHRTTTVSTSQDVKKEPRGGGSQVQKTQNLRLQSTNRSVRKQTVEQNQSKTSKYSQQFLHNLPVPSSKATEEEVPGGPLAAILAYGWQEYRLENFTKSEALFLQAIESDSAAIRDSAEYGLVYSYLQLGKTDAALPLLQQFVAQDEQLEFTAPALAAILFERNDFTALNALLPKLSPVQQKEWQEKIVSAHFQQDMLTLMQRGETKEVESFIRRYRSFVKECQQSEQFFRMAVFLVESSPTLAVDILTELSHCQPQDQHWQERIVREQLHLMSNKDLLLVASAQPDVRVSESIWKRLLQETLWLRISAFEPGSLEYDSFVHVLHELDPNNTKAASMAAWSCYQRGEYKCSRDIFASLVQNNPSDDALLGLAYSMQKSGNFGEALELLSQYPDKTNTLFNQLRHDLHAMLGGELFQSKRYEAAAGQLKQALMFKPEDMALKEMLLWSRYHLGETMPLADFLWQQYEQEGSVDSAKSLSNLLGTLNDPVFTRKVMDGFAQSEREDIRKLAGDYAFQQKHPVLANQIYQGQSPYAGSAVSALDTMFHFRSKKGDEGTSKLSVSTFMMKQQFSTRPGKTWSATLFPLYMDSGSLPVDLPVGSAFRHLQKIEGDPEAWQKNVLAWGWRGGLQVEGDVDWDISVGTTPLNGVVSPTLVGKIQISESDWVLSFARDPVRESMLSWIGQTDPYGGREWGRVVQTSLGAAKTITFSEWWLTFEGKYGWYQGESVEQNTSLTASMSGGYTTDWENYKRSTGLFLLVRGFNRNSNFYTFGHGGYYSPAKQLIAGPFLRFVTSAAHRYWLDVSCSAGLNYRQTDDAPHYGEFGDITLEPNDPAWQDLLGIYKGESETGLGLDARARGLLPLSKGWFVGGEAALNNVADFTQWQLAVVLRYRFGKGMGLGLPERDFSMLTSLLQ